MFSGRCKRCMWWDNKHASLKDLPDSWGYCRKHKPVVYMAQDKRYHGGFPLLDAEDFCGEFRDARESL